MRRAYGLVRPGTEHPAPTPFLVGAAAIVALTCQLRSPAVTGVAVVVAWRSTRRWEARRARAIVVLALLAVTALWRAGAAEAGLRPDRLGPFDGWGRLVDDPQPFDGATRIVVEIDGERYEAWIRGRARRLRVAEWHGGEFARLSGVRETLGAGRAGRVGWQHVVGALELDWVGDVRAGSAIDRASNRVRAAIEDGAASLPHDDGALFRGLVVGDDRDQPRAMVDRFRATGLSHLTAVSGQNVAFVLAAGGPLLRRLRPWWRWGATLGLVGWFVSLTRFEPSIVRAGAMAAIAATAFVLGRERSASRLLVLAVIALLLVDPLLVGSVGFWLSVGATAGVTGAGPAITARLQRAGPLAAPLGATLGAQLGVLAPALVVFGRLPLVSVPANLLAVPVAGFVMLYGLPAGIAAGLVPAAAPVLMFPCRVGVRWVDSVALVAERLEPSGVAVWVGWGVLVVALGAVAAMNRDHHECPPADR